MLLLDMFKNIEITIDIKDFKRKSMMLVTPYIGMKNSIVFLGIPKWSLQMELVKSEPTTQEGVWKVKFYFKRIYPNDNTIIFGTHDFYKMFKGLGHGHMGRDIMYSSYEEIKES